MIPVQSGTEDIIDTPLWREKALAGIDNTVQLVLLPVLHCTCMYKLEEIYYVKLSNFVIKLYTGKSREQHIAVKAEKCCQKNGCIDPVLK